MDSGCSRHMTGDPNIFLNLKKKDGGEVTFGDNAKGKVIGIGKVGTPNSTCIDDVLLVSGLKHNLLSVSQLCDKGYKVSFDPKSCIVSKLLDNSTIFKGERVGNVYLIDLENLANQDVKCLISLSNDSWLWQRRLGHASMDLLGELCKDDLVVGLPKIKFSKDKICGPCQMVNQKKILICT